MPRFSNIRNSAQIMVIGARGIPNVEGGAEKNAETLFPRVVKAGYMVDLLGLASHLHGKEYEGVRLHPAPHLTFWNTDKLLYYVFALRKALGLRPDIVHLQGLGAAIFLVFYKVLGFKVVVRYGSADYILGKWGVLGRLGFRFSEWQLRFADAIISVTPALSRRLAQRGIVSNVHTIPNALDDAAFVASSHKEVAPYILVVGRVTSQKNILTLIDAFNLFAASHPDYELHIAGGLDDRPYYAVVAEKLNDKIRLLGKVPRNEVPSLLSSAKFFVNISLHEGSSNASLEAISHGLPIVLSDIPENRDIGLADTIYVSPNDPEAIAAKFHAVTEDPTSYIVDKQRFLSWEQVAEKTLDVYGAVLRKTSKEAGA